MVVHRPGRAVHTERGAVTADVVVRATEAYTRDLPGERRSLVPLYSLMIATEPLPAAVWDEIGLRDHETFSDDRRMVIYGQRTVDDRIAFGGRGARYRFGSRIDPAVEQRSDDHDRVEATLRELLPMIGDAADHPPVGRRARRAARLARRPLASIVPPASPGPAATSAKAWLRRTSPDAPSPI